MVCVSWPSRSILQSSQEQTKIQVKNHTSLGQWSLYSNFSILSSSTVPAATTNTSSPISDSGQVNRTDNLRFAKRIPAAIYLCLGNDIDDDELHDAVDNTLASACNTDMIAPNTNQTWTSGHTQVYFDNRESFTIPCSAPEYWEIDAKLDAKCGKGRGAWAYMVQWKLYIGRTAV